VGVVHGLQCDTGVIAIEIAVLDKVLDRIDHLEHVQFSGHARRAVSLTFFRRLACSKRASSTV
jgi:hypothetical protein